MNLRDSTLSKPSLIRINPLGEAMPSSKMQTPLPGGGRYYISFYRSFSAVSADPETVSTQGPKKKGAPGQEGNRKPHRG